MRAVIVTGKVNPELTIIVGSYVSGVIQQLSCDYNTPVKAGQICAKIDPRPYQTAVNQDKANLAVAQAQLKKDKANLTYAKLNSDRNRYLAQRQSVSQDAADLAKSTYDQAAAQIGLDQATIAQHQAELDVAQVNLGYTDIVSPRIHPGGAGPVSRMLIRRAFVTIPRGLAGGQPGSRFQRHGCRASLEPA